MDFKEHKDATADDCQAIADMISQLGDEVRNGDIGAFTKFFVKGGTEEGDASINAIMERLLLRFYYRESQL